MNFTYLKGRKILMPKFLQIDIPFVSFELRNSHILEAERAAGAMKCVVKNYELVKL